MDRHGGPERHPIKTRIVDATPQGGFGYHFERGYRWPREKSLQKFKVAIRAKTRRTNGHSLKAIIVNGNRTWRGWSEYFKHSPYTTFAPLDQWMRMRLRSILGQRRGRDGPGRGRDQLWPNAFFAQHGLFSWATAHARAGQSSCR
jgi:RNA-directed DNA polymerase